MSINEIAERAVFEKGRIERAYSELSPDQRQFFNQEHGVGPYSEVRQDPCGAWPDYRTIAHKINTTWGNHSPAANYLAAIRPEYIQVQPAIPQPRLPSPKEIYMRQ